ncbi:NB-ARC domain-containing protein [Actinomadura algeriensis]|uniref:O-acetyl-ADP-ribose deacetylase (Regulator of RNase III)/transcriptional regulator with XRE-family HTH domain n=1 Tax=Actinomadura algeriensis TaxID=1679523 RepID=A0ABR9JSQ1_9ACTN|nr:NB-ARC domain-containing protein [Actinomadura algeriensis]MBE1533160.1 O-acetyl-ADP-ribose deacetylase (regulator of RNase III)/transcriptional regulator with XRE-family HTH domain [Actinomadura algeriensis]
MTSAARTRRGDADLPPGPARDLVDLFRALRRRRSLTIGRIAVGSGLAASHVSEVLRGWKAPSPNAAEAIARTLGADRQATLKARDLAEALTELNRHTRAKERGSGVPAGRFDVPPPPSHFCGRATETERAESAIAGAKDPHRAAVVQIYGPAGVGKTAVACHLAHNLQARYPDGCLFVDFGALDDASAVHARLLARLGVRAADVPADPAEARALYLSVLRHRSVLVVADDVTTSAQVGALVPASRTCAVIVTGRRHLDALDDCRAIRLGPLAATDSVALLAAIAEQSGEVPGAELARLAASCGGIPRSLRMAAARLRRSAHELDEPADEPADAAPPPGRAVPRPRQSGQSGQIPDSTRYEYGIRGGPAAAVRRIVGIVTGDIRRVRDIDVWVNSENTDMKMARVEEYTISAIVRYEGARRDAAGRVVEDVIADDLARRVPGAGPVAPGTAIRTGPGGLAESHNVRAIVHVAAVYGEPGAGYRQVREVGRCVTNALIEAERVPDPGRDVTVLFPMLGTGQGGGSIERTAAVLIGAAADYLADAPVSRISAVWFLAHTYAELAAFQDVIEGDPRFAAA